MQARRGRRWSRAAGLSCLVAVAGALFATGAVARVSVAHESSLVTVSRRIAGLPRSSRGVAAELRAVSLTDGSIAASTTPSHGRYALRLPRGPYLLVLSVIDLRRGHHGRVTIGSLVNAASGRVGYRISARGASAALASARAEAAVAGSGAIGVGAVPISAPSGSGDGSLAEGGLIDGLLPQCQARGRKLIDTTRYTKQALQREQQLSDEGRTALKLNLQPVTPTLNITGSVRVAPNGKPVADLTVTDTNTGEVIDHIVTAGDPGEDLAKFLHLIGSRVGKRECSQPEPPLPRPGTGTGTSGEGGGPKLPAAGHVMWEGSYRLSLAHEPPRSYSESGRWLIEGTFNKAGEAKGARVLSLSGGRDFENENECGEASFKPAWSLDASANPLSWALGTNAKFPSAGGLYAFPISPSVVPYTETLQCGGEHVLPGKSIPVYSEMQYLPKAKLEERESSYYRRLRSHPARHTPKPGPSVTTASPRAAPKAASPAKSTRK